MDELTRKRLDSWAVQAFATFRRPCGDRTLNACAAELSEDVAGTVGTQAARMGVGEDALSEWLQGAYGRIWVRQSGMFPCLDMKDVRKVLMDGYYRERNSHNPIYPSLA